MSDSVVLKWFRAVVGVAVLICFLQIELAAQCSDADAATREAITVAWANHFEAHRVQDPEAAVQMYTEDMWIQWAGGERRGVDAQETLYRDEYEYTQVHEGIATIEDLEVCGDVAHEINSISVNITLNGEPVTNGSRGLHIWTRQPDGQWKIRRSVVFETWTDQR